MRLRTSRHCRVSMKFPVRIKCATLAWNALQQGLEEIETADA